MYRRQQIQSRMQDQDLDTDALDNYVRERFVAPQQSYAEVGEDQVTQARPACCALSPELGGTESNTTALLQLQTSCCLAFVSTSALQT